LVNYRHLVLRSTGAVQTNRTTKDFIMASSRWYKLRKFTSRPKGGGEYINYSMTVPSEIVEELVSEFGSEEIAFTAVKMAKGVMFKPSLIDDLSDEDKPRSGRRAADGSAPKTKAPAKASTKAAPAKRGRKPAATKAAPAAKAKPGRKPAAKAAPAAKAKPGRPAGRKPGPKTAAKGRPRVKARA
jgi:hypothetical protein